MLIFGYGPRAPRDHGEAAPATCRNCRNPVWFHYVTQRNMVSLFFVPLVPAGRQALLLCPTCGFRRELAGRERHLAEAMVAATGDFRAGRLAPDDYHRYLEQFWDELEGAGSVDARADGHPSTGGWPRSGLAGPPTDPVAPAESGEPAAADAPPPDPATRSPGPSPGWYPDPFGQARERYWDGDRWTQGTNPPAI